MQADELTTEQLAALARLEAAARRAPWEVVDRPEEHDSYVGMMWTRRNGHGMHDQDSTVLDHDTAAFIAAIRNAAPALLAEVARLRKQLSEARTMQSGTDAFLDTLPPELLGDFGNE